MVFANLLDPVLGPLLALNPLWTILILSFGITFLITLAYKYLTDQEEMKRLKKKMKKYQEKIKKAQKKDPDKAMQIQQDAMSVNMKYMKKSFKPTLYTFIPIIIIFGWMNAHLTYVPIGPGDNFNVTAEMVDGLDGQVSLASVPPQATIQEPVKNAAKTVTWSVQAPQDPGDYKLVVEYGNRSYDHNVLVSETDYSSPSKSFDDAPVKKVKVGLNYVLPLGDFSIFGWNPGWLGTYIIFSIVFSMGLRKLMGIA